MLATNSNQVSQKGHIPLLIHHFFYLFNENVKTLEERLKKAVFHLFTECTDGLFHKAAEWFIKYGVI